MPDEVEAGVHSQRRHRGEGTGGHNGIAPSGLIKPADDHEERRGEEKAPDCAEFGEHLQVFVVRVAVDAGATARDPGQPRQAWSGTGDRLMAEDVDGRAERSGALRVVNGQPGVADSGNRGVGGRHAKDQHQQRDSVDGCPRQANYGQCDTDQ